MWAEAGGTCGLEYGFVVFPCLFALFAFDELLKLLFVSDKFLLFVCGSVLLDGIQIGIVVEVVYF